LPTLCAPTPRRVPHRRVRVAALVRLRHPAGAELEHVVLAAEADRPGGAHLGAGRLHADRHAVGAQRAFVRPVVHGRDARDVEGTAGDAVAAADAVLADEVDDAVRVLDDRPRRRAGLEAARILAVHAAVIADEPLEPGALVGLLHLHFGEAHDGPGLRGEVRRVVVLPDVRAH